jgi:hypothetical protein
MILAGCMYEILHLLSKHMMVDNKFQDGLFPIVKGKAIPVTGHEDP